VSFFLFLKTINCKPYHLRARHAYHFALRYELHVRSYVVRDRFRVADSSLEQITPLVYLLILPMHTTYQICHWGVGWGRGGGLPSWFLKIVIFLCFCTQHFVLFRFCPPKSRSKFCPPPPGKNWNDVPATYGNLPYLSIGSNYCIYLCRLSRSDTCIISN